MRLLLTLLLALPLFTACSVFKPGCFIQEKAEAVAVDAIVANLQCSNQEAVHADMHTLVGKLGLCKSETGMIADTFCPVVVSAVSDFVSKNAIPMTWQCSAENAKDKLGEVLLDLCKKIPVSK
jgi:hypothetical protein